MARRGEGHDEIFDEQTVLQAFQEVSTSFADLEKLTGSGWWLRLAGGFQHIVSTTR